MPLIRIIVVEVYSVQPRFSAMQLLAAVFSFKVKH
jgi:hypothetical protein